MITAVVAFFASAILRQDPTISYAGPAERLTNLLPHLSLAAGRKLRADSSVADDVMVVDVKGVALQELCDKLAMVTNGQWAKASDEWTLSRPATYLTDLEVQRRKERTKALEKQVGDLVRQLTKPYDSAAVMAIQEEHKDLEKLQSGDEVDPNAEAHELRRGELERMAPAPRALARCLLDVDLSAIAAMPIGSRIVYSNRPTPMQRPLGRHADEAIQKLNSEQLAWGSALQATPGSDPLMEDEEIEFFKNAGGGFQIPLTHDPWQRSLPFTQSPVRILLSIANKWYGSLESSMTVIDRSGQPILTYEFQFEPSPNENVAPKWHVTKAHDLTPTDEVKATKTALEIYGEGSRVTLPPQTASLLRPYLVEAEAHDPLELSAGMLRKASEVQSLNLVALIPDDGLITGLLDDEGKQTDEGVFAQYQEQGEVSFTSESGWLIGQPKDRFKALSRRVDRRALAKIALNGIKNGHFGLDEWSELQAAAGVAPEYHFVTWFVGAASGCGLPSDMGNPSVMVLYGSLSKAQKALLRSGGVIKYSDLAAQQREALATMIYGAQYSNRGEMGGEGFRFLDTTDELPNGLPSNGRLRAVARRHRRIEFLDPDNPQSFPYYSVDGDEAQPGFMWSGPPPKIPKKGVDATVFAIRPENSLEFQWELAPNHFSTVDFSEAPEAALSAPVPFDKLPDDVKPAVKAGLKFMSSFGKLKDTGDGGGRYPLQQFKVNSVDQFRLLEMSRS